MLLKWESLSVRVEKMVVAALVASPWLCPPLLFILVNACRLVFTDEQVYFERNTTNCCESIHSPLDMLHVGDGSRTHEYLRAGILGTSQQQPYGTLEHAKLPLSNTFSRYLSNVEVYSAKRLRYGKDALNAFQGIIQRFSKQMPSLGNYLGLSYPCNSEQGTSYFVYSLTWRHKAGSRPRRRQNYPSWTWAGWEGQVQYELDWGKRSLFYTRVWDLGFETPDNATGNVIVFKDLAGLSQGNPNFTILHITAAAVTLGDIPYQPTKNPAWS
ncbi:hypothetical protein F5B21DRAFT_476287 [Xylaria acuta]|nr:hypothetical protein F5B21DRAFT_476287 [Xylaria acuta]